MPLRNVDCLELEAIEEDDDATGSQASMGDKFMLQEGNIKSWLLPVSSNTAMVMNLSAGAHGEPTSGGQRKHAKVDALFEA